MNSQLEQPTGHGRGRIILVGVLFLVALLLVMIKFGPGLWARLLGDDRQAIAKIMPATIIALVEVDLLQLQNEESRAVAAAFAPLFADANIPFSNDDPTTAFNLFDNTLQELLGLTVSEDVRPWVGLNAAIALLPPTEAGDQQWLLAATIRDADNAEIFIDKVAQNSASAATRTPVVAERIGNVLVVASDAATLALASASDDKLSDLPLFEETLNHLDDKRVLTVYLAQPQSVVDQPMAMANAYMYTGLDTLSQLWPVYTAVGISGYATQAGIQFDLVGLHDGLTDTQQALLANNTAVDRVDQLLPGQTAVLLLGQRLDLVWQMLKPSFGSLGYSEADIDEAADMFSGLFGFNIDTDLLSNLTGTYAVALFQDEASHQWQPLLLAEHADGAQLTEQLDALVRGVGVMGLETTQTDGVYQLSQADDQPLLAFSQYQEFLLLTNVAQAATAVGPSDSALSQQPHYANIWRHLPDGATPFLFVDINQLAAQFGESAMPQPIEQLIGGRQHNPDLSQSTFILLINTDR